MSSEDDDVRMTTTVTRCADTSDEEDSGDEIDVPVRKKIAPKSGFIDDEVGVSEDSASSDEEEADDEDDDDDISEIIDDDEEEGSSSTANNATKRKIDRNKDHREIAFMRKHLGIPDVSDQEEDDEDEDEPREVVNPASFFDKEAELSGSEASSDEDEEGDDEYKEDEITEVLPEEEDQRDINAKILHKQMLDDTKRDILLYQERLLEDGDLHIEGQRTKNFRWRDNNEDLHIRYNVSSDEEDDAPQFEDQGVKINWKPIEEGESRTAMEDLEDNGTHDEFLLPSEFKPTHQNLPSRAFGGPVNSILSYVVKDKEACAFLSKSAISPKVSLRTPRPIKRKKKFTTKAVKRVASIENTGAAADKPDGPNMLQLLAQFE